MPDLSTVLVDGMGGGVMALILVTGSRTWTDRQKLGEALIAASEVDDRPGKRLALMHGDCPSGADAMAAELAQGWGWIMLQRPADWNRYGKRAGYRRNDDMVTEARALETRGTVVMVLAFVRYCRLPGCASKDPHWTHGSAHCAATAEDAGLSVEWIRDLS